MSEQIPTQGHIPPEAQASGGLPQGRFEGPLEEFLGFERMSADPSPEETGLTLAQVNEAQERHLQETAQTSAAGGVTARRDGALSEMQTRLEEGNRIPALKTRVLTGNLAVGAVVGARRSAGRR